MVNKPLKERFLCFSSLHISLLRRLHIIMSPRADNLPWSFVFHKRLQVKRILSILCAICSSNLIIYGLHSVTSFPVFMFRITGTRLAPPDVKETYCILHKCRADMLLCSWQQPRRSASTQLFSWMWQTRVCFVARRSLWTSLYLVPNTKPSWSIYRPTGKLVL